MARKSGRFLAPIALAAVIVGVYLIVHNGLATHRRTLSHSQTSSLLTPSHSRRAHHRAPKYYRVKPGDTLSAISVATHVSILQLDTLNPGLSPNSLQTGQRLRLRR